LSTHECLVKFRCRLSCNLCSDTARSEDDEAKRNCWERCAQSIEDRSTRNVRLSDLDRTSLCISVLRSVLPWNLHLRNSIHRHCSDRRCDRFCGRFASTWPTDKARSYGVSLSPDCHP